MSLDTSQPDKAIRKLRRFLKKSDSRPSPEEIHDFRTHTRRFEATLEAFAMSFKRNEKRLLRDLSRLRKRAGKIRDMDVLTACASTARVDGEEDCALQLVEHLGARRYAQAKKMRALVDEYGPVLRRRLRRSRGRLQKLLLDEQTQNRPSPTLTAMATALELSSKLHTPVRLDRRNLHSYRLKIKELRSVLQMSNSADSQPFVKKLGEVKDAIGEWHDWKELVAMAPEVLDHGGHCELLRELKRIDQVKFEKARSLAYGMRQTFLDSQKEVPADSKNRHRRKLKVTQPVLVATSAIAN